MGKDTIGLNYDIFDDDDEVDAAGDDEGEIDCGLGPGGQCSMAGTEHCDFCCPNRMSEWFAGSPAWCKKHKR